MNTEELASLLAIPKLPSYIARLERELLAVAESAGHGLRKSVLRVIQSGGMRLRPVVVIAAASSRGLTMNADVLAAAAAIELVHQASLVHDDIIDKAKLRKDIPTVAAQEGLDCAILAGDFLLSEGFGKGAAVNKQTAYALAKAVSAMSEGQALELTGSYKANPINDVYIETARKKAGALISAACQAGGLCAGLSRNDIDCLGEYGETFGISFQIIDDIVDGDFQKNLTDKAAAEARRYSVMSAKALENFSDSPAAVGLAKLPGIYLENSLRKSKLSTR